ncbi:MAG: hypothetical protein LBV74_01075 [Tannerella sp.]|jgi:hypothetical protein|nr:hypothetical protein [Tannerella sp.]
MKKPAIPVAIQAGITSETLRLLNLLDCVYFERISTKKERERAYHALEKHLIG